MDDCLNLFQMHRMQTVFFNFAALYAKLVSLFKLLLCFLSRKSHSEGPDELDEVLPSVGSKVSSYDTHSYSSTVKSWNNESWGEDDESLKQVVCLDNHTGLSKSKQSEVLEDEPEIDYFSEMAPKITSNPKIVSKSYRKGFTHCQQNNTLSSFSSDGASYYNTGCADELQDWQDETESQMMSSSGWGAAEESQMLDDVINLAESNLKEQKRQQMQLRIQQHQERNLRKQMQKNASNKIVH